jgi:phospholipid/cholesterol/gamma-HCH transport system ATP-binding protein
MGTALINLENVSFAFNGSVVLDDVSLSIDKGETTVILGPSGAGKSTIIKIILGLLKPSKGKVIVDKNNICEMDDDDLFPVRKKMGVVFQGNALFDSLNVEDNVAYFLNEHHALSPAETKERVSECLSFVNLEGTEKKFPEELSGGMKKRVAIARAISFHPEIILYDEPTTGLDPVNSKIIIDMIRKIQDRGATSVVVTHIIKDAIAVGDRFAVIEDGKVKESGSIDSLLEDERKNSEFLAELKEEADLYNKVLSKKEDLL